MVPLQLKVGALLSLQAVAALVCALAAAAYLRASRTDDAFVNIAGRQRMLAIELRDWARMVGRGDDDHEGIRSRMREFDESLATLREGGSVRGAELDPPEPAVAIALTELAGVWASLRGDLETLGNPSTAVPERQAAAARTVDRLPGLRDSADGVVNLKLAHIGAKRQALVASLWGAFALAMVVLSVALYATRRGIVQPVVELAAAARRVQANDLSARVEARASDEVGQLTHAFNAMASGLENLLEALELRRKHADALLQAAPIWLCVLDDELRVLHANPSFCAGVAPEDPHARPLADLLDSPELAQHIRSALRSQVSSVGRRIEAYAGGKRRAFRVGVAHTRLLEDRDRLVLALEEITTEEAALAEARDSTGRFEGVFEHGTDGMVLADERGFITHFNRAAERMFGWHREEVVGRQLEVLLPAQFREAHERAFQRVVQGEAESDARVRNLVGVTREGRTFPVECTFSLHRETAGATVLGVLRDVTEQRELESRLMQVDRMAAIGTITASVAHEVNNPLQYVLTNIDVALERLPGATNMSDRREIMHGLTEARDGANRMASIVRDLTTFSRGSSAPIGPTELIPVVEWAARTARPQLRNRARLVQDFAPVPRVLGNPPRLAQVFLNLLLNASQALDPHRGDGNEIRIVVRPHGEGGAIVEVSDTGRGISAAALPRIFDPFFTTKPEGEGTGLGLSISRSIVADCKGTISAANRPAGGAVFTVRLPPSPTA